MIAEHDCPQIIYNSSSFKCVWTEVTSAAVDEEEIGNISIKFTCEIMPVETPKLVRMEIWNLSP